MTGGMRFVWKAGMLAAALSLPQAANAAEGAPPYAGRHDPFAGKSLAETVRELADREAIRELIAVYAQRVAHGQSVADLFTEDGLFVSHRPGHPDRVSRGRAALEERFGEGALVAGRSLPMIHNVVLRIEGDEARGVCSNEVRSEENERSIVASGWYDDRFRRVDGHWKFASREATFFHWTPLDEGWARPAN